MKLSKKVTSVLCAAALTLSVSLPVVGAAEPTMEKLGKQVSATIPRTDSLKFTDAAQIDHWIAVSTLADLGVIAGKDSGAFDPAASVTRAEMAKMVCAVRFGGHDLMEGPVEDYTFSDARGHWAEKYISDCAQQGIIVGRGEGAFDPNTTVTAAEAAKMALVLLGYPEDVFSLTGPKWKDNTVAIAYSAKLFKDIADLNVDVPLTRDNAAQLLYNALYATTLDAREELQENGEITTSYTPTSESLLMRVWGYSDVNVEPPQPK